MVFNLCDIPTCTFFQILEHCTTQITNKHVIITDSGVESSTTYAGLEGATSDGEIPQSFDEDTISQEGERI